jgi:heme/copper-type cytochrome/quinol oxidase subunit 2
MRDASTIIIIIAGIALIVAIACVALYDEQVANANTKPYFDTEPRYELVATGGVIFVIDTYTSEVRCKKYGISNEWTSMKLFD